MVTSSFSNSNISTMISKKFLIAISLLFFIASSCDNTPQNSSVGSNSEAEDFDNSDWMSVVFASKPNTPLLDLIVPGTNESLTNLLNENSVASNFPSPHWSDSVWNTVDKKVLMAFSKNQDWSILKQLKAGVRYFEFNLESLDNGIWSAHNFISNPIEPVIDELSKFSANHPKELIMIDFDRVNIDVALYGELLQLFIDRLGRKVAEVSKLNAQTTIQDLWSAGESIILISSYPPQTLRQQKLILPRTTIINDIHSSGFYPGDVLNDLKMQLKESTADMFNIVACTQFPGDSLLLNAEKSEIQSILDICNSKESMNSTFVVWFPEMCKLVTDQNKRINVVKLDQIQTNPEIIPEIIAENKK